MTQKLNLTVNDVDRITSFQSMYLRPGDVVLVRSKNVPQYGDHFIVVTGPVVKKPHGMRPQTDVYTSRVGDRMLLDIFDINDDLLVALKLGKLQAEEFLELIQRGDVIKINIDDNVKLENTHVGITYEHDIADNDDGVTYTNNFDRNKENVIEELRTCSTCETSILQHEEA